MTLPRGPYCAMITPLEAGRVSRRMTEELIEAVIESGFAGLLVAGSTGEGALLTENQYRDMVSFAVAAAGHRLQVVAGALGPSGPQSLRSLQVAAELGADSGLVISPYYFKRGEVDLVAYFAALADESPLPLIVYNFPGTTGQRITSGEIARLAPHEQIVGYKDSNGDLSSLHQVVVDCGDRDFRVFQGLATLSYVSLCIGVDGVFSATANIIPKLDAEIFKTYRAGDLHRCTVLQKLQIDLVRALTVAGLPVGLGIKQALRILGKGGTDWCYPAKPSLDTRMLEKALNEIYAYWDGAGAEALSKSGDQGT